MGPIFKNYLELISSQVTHEYMVDVKIREYYKELTCKTLSLISTSEEWGVFPSILLIFFMLHTYYSESKSPGASVLPNGHLPFLSS